MFESCQFYKMIKMIIGLVILVIVFIIIGIKNKKTDLVANPVEFVQLSSTQSSNKHLPKVSVGWMEELEEKYINQTDNKYDNIYYALSIKLCNEVYDRADLYRQGKMSHTALLHEMTKEQRIYQTLVNFEGQVNNGGVYQFLFNYPELSFIALEAFQIIGADQLAKDYEKVLQEYFGKFNTIQDLYTKFQDNSKEWDKRWNAFAEGYKQLPTAAIIETYFFKEDFSKDYQTKTVAFVKQNRQQLLIEE